MALFSPIIIAFVFAMWPQGDQGQIFGTMGILLLWALPFVQWARQIRARRRFRKHQGEQCVPPNTLSPPAQGGEGLSPVTRTARLQRGKG
jgi:hypothetical protein